MVIWEKSIAIGSHGASGIGRACVANKNTFQAVQELELDHDALTKQNCDIPQLPWVVGHVSHKFGFDSISIHH